MTSNTSIGVTGFFFSGSSAVSDFLLDHGDCISFSSHNCEPRLLRGESEGGIGHVLGSLRKTVKIDDREAFLAALRTSILGEDASNFNQMMNTNLRRRLGPQFDALLEELFSAIPELDGNGNAEAFYAVCKNVFGRSYRLIPDWKQDSVVVFNNDPPSLYGTVEAALEAYPNCRVIAVLRDPFDMFFEASKFYDVVFPATPYGVKKWIDAIGASLERFAPLASHPSVMTTMFEDFVRDPAERERVRLFARAPETLREKRNFVSEKSAGNIGVHSALPQDMLEPIEAQITPLLHRVLGAAGRKDLVFRRQNSPVQSNLSETQW